MLDFEVFSLNLTLFVLSCSIALFMMTFRLITFTSGIFLNKTHIHRVYMQDTAICNACAPFSVQYANEMMLESCHCSSFPKGELGGQRGGGPRGLTGSMHQNGLCGLKTALGLAGADLAGADAD